MDANEGDAARLIPYAGDVIRVLGESEGIAFCELTVPSHFAGPPPHIHHGFDEAIYVLSGALTMVKDREEWWKAQLQRERERQAVWEESLQTVVREGEVLERELRTRSRRRGLLT